MRTEEATKPEECFLCSSEYFSDSATAIWQAECVKRCKDKDKSTAYERYVNWVRKENEVAIFMLYSYADLEIPKTFDIIFQLDKPENYIQEEYLLTQSIHEAWMPLNNISHGHKHLCILKFKSRIPEMINLLYRADEKFCTTPNSHIKLGFCHSENFEQIKNRIKQMVDKAGE